MDHDNESTNPEMIDPCHSYDFTENKHHKGEGRAC